MDNQFTYILLGGGIQIALIIAYKILRKQKCYWIILISTLILALFGFLNIDRISLEMAKGSGASFTFLPLLFMIYFGAFRQIFIKLFKNEPLIAGYMQTSWNQGEYRKLHMGDVFFTILTVILPFLTIMLFDYIRFYLLAG